MIISQYFKNVFSPGFKALVHRWCFTFINIIEKISNITYQWSTFDYVMRMIYVLSSHFSSDGRHSLEHHGTSGKGQNNATRSPSEYNGHHPIRSTEYSYGQCNAKKTKQLGVENGQKTNNYNAFFHYLSDYAVSVPPEWRLRDQICSIDFHSEKK